MEVNPNVLHRWRREFRQGPGNVRETGAPAAAARTGVHVQRVKFDIDVTGIGCGVLTFDTFSDFLLGMSAAQA